MSIGIARCWWQVAVALVATLSPTPIATQAKPDLPPRSVLLFVAGWCAPCHAEIARLDEIATAARPFRVLVVSLDDERRAAAMLRGVDPVRRWRPAAAAMARIRSVLFADVAGLPYSVAVDDYGRVCGDSRRGLDAERTGILTRRCMNAAAGDTRRNPP